MQLRPHHTKNDPDYATFQAHLSDVYAGRSKVNNDTPRSVSNPPPWANLDRRVLSPIPDKKRREDHWNNDFSSGRCLEDEPRSGGRYPHAISSGRPGGTRPRPASAGVRRSNDHAGTANRREGNAKTGGRPMSANVRGRDASDGYSDGFVGERNAADLCGGAASGRRRRRPSDRSEFCPGRGESLLRENVAKRGGVVHRRNSIYSPEDREILDGGYKLDDNQESVFRKFVTMLVDFDSCIAADILRDAFREAQLANGLHNFTGCDAD